MICKGLICRDLICRGLIHQTHMTSHLTLGEKGLTLAWTCRIQREAVIVES